VSAGSLVPFFLSFHPGFQPYRDSAPIRAPDGSTRQGAPIRGVLTGHPPGTNTGAAIRESVRESARGIRQRNPPGGVPIRQGDRLTTSGGCQAAGSAASVWRPRPMSFRNVSPYTAVAAAMIPKLGGSVGTA
jgi:hypothetical protein